MNQRKKQVESEILSRAFNFGSSFNTNNMIDDDFLQGGGKKAKKLLKQTMDIAG